MAVFFGPPSPAPILVARTGDTCEWMLDEAVAPEDLGVGGGRSTQGMVGSGMAHADNLPVSIRHGKSNVE